MKRKIDQTHKQTSITSLFRNGDGERHEHQRPISGNKGQVQQQFSNSYIHSCSMQGITNRQLTARYHLWVKVHTNLWKSSTRTVFISKPLRAHPNSFIWNTCLYIFSRRIIFFVSLSFLSRWKCFSRTIGNFAKFGCN